MYVKIYCKDFPLGPLFPYFFQWFISTVLCYSECELSCVVFTLNGFFCELYRSLLKWLTLRCVSSVFFRTLPMIYHPFICPWFSSSLYLSLFLTGPENRACLTVHYFLPVPTTVPGTCNTFNKYVRKDWMTSDPLWHVKLFLFFFQPRILFYLEIIWLFLLCPSSPSSGSWWKSGVIWLPFALDTAAVPCRRSPTFPFHLLFLVYLLCYCVSGPSRLRAQFKECWAWNRCPGHESISASWATLRTLFTFPEPQAPHLLWE